MTKTCKCGRIFPAKGRRKTCPECSYERLKSKVRARMHRVRRELFGPLLKDRIVYRVTCKCPRCPDGHNLHTVEMENQPHIMPRIFCERHAVLKTAVYYDAWNETAVRV